MGRANGELLLVPDEGHAEQQGLEAELLEPAIFRKESGSEAQLAEAPAVAVDERSHAKLLRESPQLAERRGALVQVHEMRFDTALSEETDCSTGIAAFFHPKDLDFHESAARREPHGAELHEALQRLRERADFHPGAGGELLESPGAVREVHYGRHALVALRDRNAAVR